MWWLRSNVKCALKISEFTTESVSITHSHPSARGLKSKRGFHMENKPIVLSVICMPDQHYRAKRYVIFTFLVCNWSSRLTQRVMDMERCSVGGRKRCVITHGPNVNESMT